MNYIFLIGGLLLGWSLGANNTPVLFGTAVGSKMIRIKSALITASIFVILGAVLQGAHTTISIGELGRINAIGGAFTVTLATGLTTIWMIKAGLMVSITQALVGGIVAWSLFAGEPLNTSLMIGIIQSWIFSPLMAFITSFVLFKLLHNFYSKAKINLFSVDFLFKLNYILWGSIAAFTFGANNIANVVGVYLFSNPFKNIKIGPVEISSTYILLLVGSLSIAAGILTGSKNVLKTVGEKVLKLTPLAGLVVVLSHSIVLFLYSSDLIRKLLNALHLPSLPLVPLASSQVVIGAMIGIGMARGSGRLINFKVLKDIAISWIITPISAGLLSFFLLFFAQNVFQLTVKRSSSYIFDHSAINEAKSRNIDVEPILALKGKVFTSTKSIYNVLSNTKKYNKEEITHILEISRIDSISVDTLKLNQIPQKWFKPEELEEIKKLHGKIYVHSWQFKSELRNLRTFSESYNTLEGEKEFNQKVQNLIYLLTKN